MISGSLPYADLLNEVFYEGLNRQTSACLFGSAATGNWVTSRSDLDLVVMAPRDQFVALGDKIRDWARASGSRLPLLDGYALIPQASGHSIYRLDAFVKVRFPSEAQIDVIDQWVIKYRSKQLFGDVAIDRAFPETSIEELRAWALAHLRSLSVASPDSLSPEPKVVLSGLIWAISWCARMLMLLRGMVCESKMEALQWLANENPEVRHSVSLLVADYYKPDDALISITPQQSAALRAFCLRLLLAESSKV